MWVLSVLFTQGQRILLPSNIFWQWDLEIFSKTVSNRLEVLIAFRTLSKAPTYGVPGLFVFPTAWYFVHFRPISLSEVSCFSRRVTSISSRLGCSKIRGLSPNHLGHMLPCSRNMRRRRWKVCRHFLNWNERFACYMNKIIRLAETKLVDVLNFCKKTMLRNVFLASSEDLIIMNKDHLIVEKNFENQYAEN